MEKAIFLQNKIWQEQSIFIISPISDKSQGFYSKENVENLFKEGLDYILPICRSHSLCEYEPVKLKIRKK